MDIKNKQDLKKNSPYSASMTGCGFVFSEFTSLVPLMLEPNANHLIQDEIRNNNLLMMNSELTRKRAMSELQKRFNAVPRSFWEYYLALSEEDQHIALLYPILQAYAVAKALHLNVVVPQWHSAAQSIDNDLLMMELYNLSAQDPFVDSWSDATKKKIASWYQTILVQAGMLVRANQKLNPVRLYDCSWFAQQNEEWFLDACLLDSQEVMQMVQPYK